MRLVQVCDIVRTTQTDEIRKAASDDTTALNRDGLEGMWVRYGVSKTGQPSLGSETSTVKFR